MLQPRIVCLSQDAADALARVGAEACLVGVAGHVRRPVGIASRVPKLGAFSTGDAEAVVRLKPDLVLTYSDVQADLTADLVRAGLEVHTFNQRTLSGIKRMVRTVGALVDRPRDAARVIHHMERAAEDARALTPETRPAVYFEEWHEPLVCGIGWVSELIDIAGGRDVFAERARAPAAKDRAVALDEVVAEKPEVILASWCGKKVRTDAIASRPGWEAVPAVRAGRIAALPSDPLLSPGPSAVFEGLPLLRAALFASKPSA